MFDMAIIINRQIDDNKGEFNDDKQNGDKTESKMFDDFLHNKLSTTET